jgi:hypothetical protein
LFIYFSLSWSTLKCDSTRPEIEVGERSRCNCNDGKNTQVRAFNPVCVSASTPLSLNLFWAG